MKRRAYASRGGKVHSLTLVPTTICVGSVLRRVCRPASCSGGSRPRWFQLTRIALAHAGNRHWVRGACRGVLRGGLRLRHARPLDPSNLKRIMPTKETAGVVNRASGRTTPLHSGVRIGSGYINHEAPDTTPPHDSRADYRSRANARHLSRFKTSAVSGRRNCAAQARATPGHGRFVGITFGSHSRERQRLR